LTKAVAIQGDDGRIRFPCALGEDMLSKAPRDVTFFNRDGKNDLFLSGNRVHYGIAGAVVHIVDVQGNEYRECTVQDLHDAVRIVDQLDNVHFLQRPMTCRDILDNYEMDLNSIYACTSGTTKHVGVSFTEPAFVAGAFEMLYEIAGGEAQYRERPFVSNSNCFVVPPMKFATESCEVMAACLFYCCRQAWRGPRPRQTSPVRSHRRPLNALLASFMSAPSHRGIQLSLAGGLSALICAQVLCLSNPANRHC
jgi:trimethylamine--corrinoid protein Co-methyltransferase